MKNECRHYVFTERNIYKLCNVELFVFANIDPSFVFSFVK